MSIGYIIWPEDTKAACDLYLKFIIPIVARLGMPFPERLPDPVAVASGFVAGAVSEADYEEAKLRWWDELDSESEIRDMQSTQALTARIALCLLSASRSEAHRLGDHLSWFLEVLQLIPVDVHGPIQEMKAYFTYRSATSR